MLRVKEFSALLLNSCTKKQENAEGQMGCGFPALEKSCEGIGQFFFDAVLVG